MRPQQSAWIRSQIVRRLPSLAVAALAAWAGGRLRLAFDFDALTIILLCALLLWVQEAHARRTRAIAEQVDNLIALARYGPLNAEDREVIEALRAQSARSGARGPSGGFAVRR